MRVDKWNLEEILGKIFGFACHCGSAKPAENREKKIERKRECSYIAREKEEKESQEEEGARSWSENQEEGRSFEA